MSSVPARMVQWLYVVKIKVSWAVFTCECVCVCDGVCVGECVCILEGNDRAGTSKVVSHQTQREDKGIKRI